MRKRTVRKVWALINPITHAKYQASLLTPSEIDKQMIPVRTAIDLLSRGHWERENWSPIFECLNRIESITKLMRVSDNGLIDDAQRAYTSALIRREEKGSQSFKAEELGIVKEVANTYESLLGELTHAQFQRACQHTNANIDRVLKQRNAREVCGVLIEERDGV